MRGETMYEFEDDFRRALSYLIDEINRRNLFSIYQFDEPIAENEIITYIPKYEISQKFLNIQKDEDILANEFVKRMVEIFKSDSFFQSQPYSIHPIGEIHHLLNKYFQEISDKEYKSISNIDISNIDDNLLSKVISQYIGYLEHTDEENHHFFVFRAMKFPASISLISDVFQIRKIKSRELRKLIRTREISHYFQEQIINLPDMHSTFDIAIIRATAPRADPNYNNSMYHLMSLLFILKLIEDTLVTDENIYHYYKYEYRQPGIGVLNIDWMVPYNVVGSHLIEDHLVDKIKNIWNEFSDVLFNIISNRDEDDLYLAMDRFVRGFNEKRLHDKLIDFMISFESLYTKKKSQGTRIKVSRRCAHLLGETPKERLEIDENLREAYSIRSDLVHGRKLSLKKQQKLSKLKPILLGYLRQSFIYFLRMRNRNIDKEDLFNIIRECEISEDNTKLLNKKNKINKI